jgi:hypothetical protein
MPTIETIDIDRATGELAALLSSRRGIAQHRVATDPGRRRRVNAPRRP